MRGPFQPGVLQCLLCAKINFLPVASEAGHLPPQLSLNSLCSLRASLPPCLFFLVLNPPQLVLSAGLLHLPFCFEFFP